MKTTLLFLSFFFISSLFGQNVYIPDANFKAYLVGNTYINTNGDTEIQVSEASAYEFPIQCQFQNISDLTGIEAFTSLTHLVCHNNSLTSLDLSQNTALKSLLCYSNQLTSLDLSQNTALQALNCNNNQLTCLNVANGNNLNFYYFGSDTNPNLNCIQVDDAAYSTANWTHIDPQMYFSEDCNNDCSNTSSLTELSTSKNIIQILDMMGRETNFKPNTPLIYVYNDGSTERVFTIE